GRTLLEGLIRDLQGREYLFEKLTGKSVTVPVALMVSDEKSNEAHIKAICEERAWFGRGRENFLFFKQPLIPVITKEGDWSLKAPLQLNLKPGGHGVIWIQALQQKILSELRKRGKTHAVVRQINNPVAGTDYGLLAFAGWGYKHHKTFGFASCQRVLN